MVNENLRELNYHANLAGIQSQVVTRGDHIFVEVKCFDHQQLAKYLPLMMAKLLEVHCSEEVFESLKDQ